MRTVICEYCEYCGEALPDHFALWDHNFDKHPVETRPMAESLFQYSPDGNGFVSADALPPTKEEAQPYHVIWNGVGDIPVSVLVFARSAEHALERVRASVQICAERQYTPAPDKYGDTRTIRAKVVLSRLRAGELHEHVTLLDTDRIVAKVCWAHGGDFL